MKLVESLRAHRLLAIVRGKDPAAALRTVRTLAEEGIAAIEVSLTTADALTVIRRARTELGPDALSAPEPCARPRTPHGPWTPGRRTSSPRRSSTAWSRTTCPC